MQGVLTKSLITKRIRSKWSLCAVSKRQRAWQEELDRTIEWVAGLTAVDGAVILTNDYEMLGFGAKIARRRHPQR